MKKSAIIVTVVFIILSCSEHLGIIPVTGIEFDISKIQLLEGETHYLYCSVIPENATERSLVWSSSDSSVATIDQNGMLTAGQSGAATIIAESNDGSCIDYCEVIIGKQLSGITELNIVEEYQKVDVGAFIQLGIDTVPSDILESKIYWFSSDESIATVDSTGKVKAVKTGAAIITAKTYLGDFKDRCLILSGENEFISVWDVTADSNNKVIMNLSVPSDISVYVEWGDGLYEVIDHPWLSLKHEYAAPGEYEIKISGIMCGIKAGSNILEVKSWGCLKFDNDTYFKSGRLTITATDVPDLSKCTRFFKTFYQCASITNIPNIENWDTSNITEMNNMFYYASNFNCSALNWDTSKVTDMTGMFNGAKSFNGDISGWKTSAVRNMKLMFCGADSFNSDISNWNTSSVTDMSSMFSGADIFNQDLSRWKTGAVTDISRMFANTNNFNSDISGWDTSKIFTMSEMFYCASDFNQNISTWKTSSVTDMSGMFSGAISFSYNISNWAIENVNNFQSFFSSSNLSTADYDSILINWASKDVCDDVVFSVSNIRYSSSAAAARQSLIDDHHWIISDGGLAP